MTTIDNVHGNVMEYMTLAEEKINEMEIELETLCKERDEIQNKIIKNSIVIEYLTAKKFNSDYYSWMRNSLTKLESESRDEDIELVKKNRDKQLQIEVLEQKIKCAKLEDLCNRLTKKRRIEHEHTN